MAGTSVVISGTALALGDSPPIVRFGGVQVTAGISDGSTALWVIVPAGAITGPISVQTSAGTGTSTNPFVIAGPPTINTQPAGVANATVGGTASFTVSAMSLAPVNYQWFRDGRSLAGATGATLALTHLQLADAADYYVVVTNVAGTVASNVVSLSGPGAAPTLTTPPSDGSVTSGAPAGFTVVAGGATNYQWRRNGTPLAGATNAALTIGTARRADADYYDVLVYNGLTRIAAPRVRLDVAPTAYPALVAFDPAAALLAENEDYAVVSAVLPLASGRLLAAGNFIHVDGQRRHALARFTAAGAFDPDFSAPQFEGSIAAAVEQTDGKIIVGGWMLLSGATPRSHLARLNADGTLDAAFAPQLDSGVEALALQPDGKILAAGWFQNVGGQARRGLARLNPDGTLDATLNAQLDGGVLALGLQSDGAIVIGGDFNTVDGATRNHLARVSATGAVDAAFNPNVGDQVNVLALQADGKVVIGGWFTTVGGQSRSYFARVTAAGALDPAFAPVVDGGVDALAVQSDGAIVFGGWFGTVNGQLRSHLARVSSGGTIDAGFSPAATSGVTTLALQSGDRIAVGGYFSSLAGSPRARLARLNADGTLDALAPATLRAPGEIDVLLAAPGGGFYAAGAFTHLNGTERHNLARLTSAGALDGAFNPAPNGRVRALALQGDGRLVFGGGFYQVGTAYRGNLARLNADATLDAGFAPSVEGGINAIVAQSDGRIVVGGYFERAGGAARSYLARFHANGALDAGFNPAPNDEVFALALQRDGRLLVGGRFTTLATSARGYLGRLNVDGSLDALFGPMVNGPVYTLASQTDGKVLLGGSFYEFGGVPTTHLARCNADGTRDAGFTPGTALSSEVLALLPQENGRILVGGWFHVHGSAPNTARLVRLNADGSRDPAFAFVAAPPTLDPARALLLDDAGQFWAGGRHSGGYSLARLVPFTGAAPSLSTPVIAAQAVNTGGSITLSVSATGTPVPTYQWRLEGNIIPGATHSTYALTSATAAQAGNYTVVITNAVGSLTAGPMRLDVLARDLVAATTRTAVPVAGSVAAGFVIEGSVSKHILLRGVGPALAALSVPTPLTDPRLTLLDGGFASIATNDDWGTNTNAAAITTASAAVGAVALAAGGKDAALLLSLSPGTYTAVLEGADGGGGNAHVEIFDADTGNQLRLVMFTSRGPAGLGAAAHVTGFTVAGTGSRQILLRALGQSLGNSNGVLFDPVLTVYQGATALFESDDWTGSEVATAAVTAGLRALGNTRDSALLLSLAPGAYTAQVRGFNQTVGTAFLEIAQIDAGRPATMSPALTYLAPNQLAVVGGQATFAVNVLARPAPGYQWRRNGIALANGTRLSGATGPVLVLTDVAATDLGNYDVVISPTPLAETPAGAPVAASLVSPARTLTILPEFHAADVNRNRRIDLDEILRVLQLYAFTTVAGVRTGEYRTLAGTEDGFAAGPGAISTHHSADSNRDGRIDVNELARAILLYNHVESGTRTGAYRAEIGTEDGFAPGPRSSPPAG